MSHHIPLLYQVHRGVGPLLATALHAGHQLRDEVAALVILDEATRQREEDPYTDRLAELAPNYIVPVRSRFEVDLNRDRDHAVYQSQEDAWGLLVWKEQPPPHEIVERSLDEYDAFYAELNQLLKQLEKHYGRFVIFDLHSYNYLRQGPKGPPADPEKNPEVNVGTGTMDRDYWAPVIERFIHDLRQFDYLGRHLDVRENVKFQGRQFAAWVHEHFPRSGCVLAIEFKKFFMNEWTGELDEEEFVALGEALASTIQGLQEALQEI